MKKIVSEQGLVRRLPARGLRLIEYKGDAMTGAHIVPHAKLLIDASREPQNGDIVVVECERKFTVRYYKCNEHKQWLVSANRNYADMLLDHSMCSLSVVVEVITDTTLLRKYML